MEIKEVKQFKVGNKTFDNKEDAEAYVKTVEEQAYLVVTTGPDTTEGRYSFSTRNIFAIRQTEQHLAPGQSKETVVKLMEMALLKRMNKYSGVMGTIQLVPNFEVNIIEGRSLVSIASFSEHINNIEHSKEIVLNEIPTKLTTAMMYIEKIVNLME